MAAPPQADPAEHAEILGPGQHPGLAAATGHEAEGQLGDLGVADVDTEPRPQQGGEADAFERRAQASLSGAASAAGASASGVSVAAAAGAAAALLRRWP